MRFLFLVIISCFCLRAHASADSIQKKLDVCLSIHSSNPEVVACNNAAVSAAKAEIEVRASELRRRMVGTNQHGLKLKKFVSLVDLQVENANSLRRMSAMLLAILSDGTTSDMKVVASAEQARQAIEEVKFLDKVLSE